MPKDADAHDAPISREPPQASAEGAEAGVAPPHPLHATVDAWFAAHFHNSIVSRDTEVFNHLHAAVQDLKRRLTQEN